MSGIELLRPGWLLALPLLALCALLLRRRQGGAGDWGRIADPALLAAMRDMGRLEPPAGGAVSLAAMVVAGLVGLALSGPSVERRDAVAFRNRDGVVFVVDASPSLTGAPSWTVAQATIRFALAGLGSRPAGLVVFAGDAYVASDLTNDVDQLGQTLFLIDAETVPDPGSRPERGLALARGMFDAEGLPLGDVVLLTDGGGLGPETVAAGAALTADGRRLSVLTVEADDPAAAALAEVGGGEVFAVGDAEGLVGFLDEAARQRLEEQDWPLLFRADLGRWLLLVALAPALLLFRRVAA